MSNIAKHKIKTVAEAAKNASNMAFRRYGFSQREIVARWSDIVGPALADCSMPERLTFAQDERHGGTLYIKVQGSMVPELQHFEALVIERINSYYGYRAIERFVYRHGPVPTRTRKTKRGPPALTDNQKKTLEGQIKGVQNPQLHKALYQLGTEVFGFKKPEKPRIINRFSRRGMGSQKVE